MKHFYFDINMTIVNYLIMNETNNVSTSTKLKLAFTFQIPVPQTDNFLKLILATELDVKTDTICFDAFKVRLYPTTKLQTEDSPQYSNKKANTTSFINYLIKMNNEQILPFIEKNLLGKKISLLIHDKFYELSYKAKHDIRKSYQETFSELLNNVNNTKKVEYGGYGSAFIPLHKCLKDYETERLFNKINKKMKKDELVTVKIKKI